MLLLPIRQYLYDNLQRCLFNLEQIFCFWALHGYPSTLSSEWSSTFHFGLGTSEDHWCVGRRGTLLRHLPHLKLLRSVSILVTIRQRRWGKPSMRKGPKAMATFCAPLSSLSRHLWTLKGVFCHYIGCYFVPTCAIYLKMIRLKDVKYDDGGWISDGSWKAMHRTTGDALEVMHRRWSTFVFHSLSLEHQFDPIRSQSNGPRVSCFGIFCSPFSYLYSVY